MIPLETKLKLNADFVWEPMPDGCILYCQGTGQIVTVNPAADLILTYCDGESSLQQIYQSVIEDAPLEQPEFQAAVQKLVDEKVLLHA
jgi:hypothetical protein